MYTQREHKKITRRYYLLEFLFLLTYLLETTKKIKPIRENETRKACNVKNFENGQVKCPFYGYLAVEIKRI